MAKITLTNQGAGEFQTIEGRTITATQASTDFTADDVGRLIVVSHNGSSTDATHAVGQYREIVEFVDALTVRVDYPFDVTPWPEENYADGTPVREYLPNTVDNNSLNTGDDFIISYLMEDLNSTDFSDFDTVFDEVATDRKRISLADTHQLSVGTSNSVNANRGALYVDGWDFSYSSRDLYCFASDHSSGNGSGLGGIIVFGRVQPNFKGTDIEVNVTAGDSRAVTTGDIVYVEGDNSGTRQGKVYKYTGSNINGVTTASDFSGNDWIDLSAKNGYTSNECNLWWQERTVSNSSLWPSNGQPGNDGSTSAGGDGDYGHIHFNGGRIVIDKDLGSSSPDSNLASSERVFVRIYGGSGEISNRENVVRMLQAKIEGPIGGRIRGSRSMLLNNSFVRGGNTGGPFHPSASGKGQFGLWKGNTFGDKDHCAYVYTNLGLNTEIAGLEFQQVDYGAFMAGGSGTNPRLRFSNFDTNLLDTGLNDTTSSGLVDIGGGQSSSTRVFIEQDVTINIVDSALAPITESTKLVWEDSQNRENRDVDNSASNPVTTTGTFATQRMLYWDSGSLSSGDLELSDGTTHGDYDFGIVSYENENVYFVNSLANGDVDLTYTVFPDETIGDVTKAQADAYTLISTAEQWRARAKSEQYDAPHTFDVDEEWISRNGDDISLSVLKDYRFLTSSTNGALHYNSTADEIEMVVPVSGVSANIDLGASNDLTIPATYTIVGGLTCQNLVAQWADDEVVIDTSESQSYTVSVNNDSAVEITIRDAEISDLRINATDESAGANQVTVVLDGTTGTPTLGTNVIARSIIPVTVETDEALYNENSVYVVAYSSSDGSTFNDVSIPTEDKNGSNATFEFVVPQDENLYLALMYRNSSQVYELSNVAASDSVSARTITVTTDEFVDQSEDTAAVGTLVSGTAVSYDSTNSRIQMDMPVTAVTLADQPGRIAMWELMAGLGSDSDVYLIQVAQGVIDHDLITFNDIGMVIKDTDKLLVQKVSADNESIVRLNTQAIDADDETVSVADDITSATLNRTVFFSPILDNQVVGASAAASFDSRLDDRHLTADNVERLGKLQPINTN